MFSKILVAVGGPDDAEETLSLVSGLAKAFNSEVLVVHMRERVVTSAATIEKETIPEAFQFGVKIADQLVQNGIKARADIRGHRPDRLADFILDEANKFRAELIIIGGHHAHGMRDRILGDIDKTLGQRREREMIIMTSRP